MVPGAYRADEGAVAEMKEKIGSYENYTIEVDDQENGQIRVIGSKGATTFSAPSLSEVVYKIDQQVEKEKAFQDRVKEFRSQLWALEEKKHEGL